MQAIPIQDIINNSIKQERQKITKEQFSSWHPSRLGSCLRGQYFERLGVEPKEFTDRELRVFKVGHIFENWIVETLKGQDGVKIETQIKVKDRELNVSGYVDLLVEYEGQKKIYEIKSKHSQGFQYLPNLQHCQQLWLYLYLMKLPEGNLLYISKDDLRIEEYPIFLENKKLEQGVLEQIRLLNMAWEKKDPFILPLPEKDDWRAKYCRWHHKYCVNEKNAILSDFPSK